MGKIVENEWLKTEEIRENVILDEFIVVAVVSFPQDGGNRICHKEAHLRFV